MCLLSQLLKTKIAPKQVFYSGCGAVKHMWLSFLIAQTFHSIREMEMLEILHVGLATVVIYVFLKADSICRLIIQGVDIW